MAWSASAIFRALVTDALENTAALDLNSDTFKVALYNNSITPDNDATAANSAYNAGQWANTNEVSESGQWAAGGVALGNPDITNPSSGVIMFDGDDTASGSAADLANVYGCLVYDDTLSTPVADQGVCYNYFGGANSVTNGTFTVVWAANGLFRITV
ncbi:MAG: hypothetical protein ACO35E_09855 [Ilumatobacteraceae bacterium]